ncbi:hypothetical protein V499_07626, partial [Pseudogymnoascus sp. VKM F-103]
MDSPLPPTLVEAHDTFLTLQMYFNYPRHYFEPLGEPNTSYQHGPDSPGWRQEQRRHSLHASQSSPALLDHRRYLLPARRLIDFEPLREPNTAYQHGRDSPVWGQLLDHSEAQELLSFQYQDDPFLTARRLYDIELVSQPSVSSLSDRSWPDWGKEPFFQLPDATGVVPREWYAPEFQIVYSNGWINAIPVRPLGYDWTMLPVQPSQYDRDSLVSEDSEPLPINGLGSLKDPQKYKWLRAHHRSMSIERACKAWEYELRNGDPNSDPIDADTKSLFGSLERLETSFVENQPGIDAPQESFVKQPPKRYKISEMPQDDLQSKTSEKADKEELPFWLGPRLGIRLPPGMVNLAAPHIPHYLVRTLEDPLRFLPSKLRFKRNFPFKNVIPKKGQIGLHPAFRTAAPEIIFQAERDLELAKERQFQTPEEAWRSPIIGEFDGDAGREPLWEYPRTTASDGGSLTSELDALDQFMWGEYPFTSVSQRGSLTDDELQGLDQLIPETHSRSADEGSFISVFFDQAEALADVEEVTMLSDGTEAFPAVDEAIMFSNEFMESPDTGPITMFPGRDIELDQGPISSDHVMQSPMVGPVSMESPIGNQAATVEHEGSESSIEGQESDYYFGQGMEYITGEISLPADPNAAPSYPPPSHKNNYPESPSLSKRHLRKGTESPIEDEDSVFSVLEMAYRKPNRAPIVSDQDTEHQIEGQDQEETSSGESIESSFVLHEDLPIIRWLYGYWDEDSEPKGQPSSSKQVDKDRHRFKRNSADFARLPPIDFTKSYNDFCKTQFGSLLTGGGLQDYKLADEKKVEKRTEVADDPLETTEVYWPQEHEAHMRELFAEIELEGATRILTTWQEVYVERGEEGETKEEGAQEKLTETALEDSKENKTQELAVLLEQKYSQVKSWFGGFTTRKGNKNEGRKSQAAEPEPKGKLMGWIGGLTSAREKPTLESFGDSSGSVPQGPADQLVRKNSKRVSWLGGSPAKKQKQTEEVFGDSQEKIETELIHPLERKGSKRRSWFAGHSTKKQEQTKEVLGDSQEKTDPGVAQPLERKRSKRASWFGGHPAEKEVRTSEDSYEMLIQEEVHPLERKGSKRRSWLPGHTAEKEEQTKPDSEDNKLTPASVHPLERKGSKRRSWLPEHSAEREVQTSEDSHGKTTQGNVQPLERKGSKRRSWLPRHPPEREVQTSDDSHGKIIQENVQPLERKASKRRSWFLGHNIEKEDQTQRDSEDSYGKSTQASANPLERKASKRRSWFPGHPSRKEGQIKGDSGESCGMSTQASFNLLERKASKRRSWFPRNSSEKEVRTSEDSHGKSTQGSGNPLERKASKRRSWFGMVPPENEEPTEDALEGNDENLLQEPVTPLERKRSKRRSWFGITPAKKTEQTQEDFDGSKEKIARGRAEPSEQIPAKRASWLGGLNTQKEKQTKKVPDDSQDKITKGPADHPERKHRKRASLFGLPSENEKTEQENQEERKRKRSQCCP